MPTYGRIYTYEFNTLLRGIPEISIQEREFLNKYFANRLSEGLSADQLKLEIGRLKLNASDPISSEDAERVKRVVLKALGVS